VRREENLGFQFCTPMPEKENLSRKKMSARLGRATGERRSLVQKDVVPGEKEKEDLRQGRNYGTW